MVNTNCSVYGCKSTSKHNKDLKFHRFPRDARCQYWIKACCRPDLRDLPIEKLYEKYVCSLHFEEWMYMKTKLKSAAVPIINLPSTSLHSMSTQTEAPTIEIIKDLQSKGVQQQIETAAVGVSVVASTSAHTSQTTTTNYTPRKRKLRKQLTTCVKKLKYMEDAMSKEVDVTHRQFLHGCDKFLSPNLSNIVKAQANLKPHSKNNSYSKEFKLFCLNI